MPQPNRQLTRGRKLSIALIVLLVLVLAFGGAVASVYTEWLWFLEDAQKPQVFAARFNTRLALFALGFLVSFVFIGYNLSRVLRSVTLIRPTPEHPAAELMAILLRGGTRSLNLFAWIAAGVLGIFFGLAARTAWEKLLLFLSAQPFNQTDPIFGLDIGFYVFRLGLLESLSSGLFALFLITLLLVAGAYYGLQGLAGMARMRLGGPWVTPQINLLGALLLGTIGLQLWLARYAFMYAVGPLFTGPGATDATARIPMLAVMAYGCWAAGLICALGAWKLRNFRVQVALVAALVLIAVLGYGVYPAVLQATVVSPNELEKETPYIRHAIAATRTAYMLDRIKIVNVEPTMEPTSEDLEAAIGTLENMRLWDYRVLNDTYDALQVIKQYYAFREVDVDRYPINGKQTMVNIAARELYVDGLGPEAKTWQNLRFQFTHGFGVAMSPVNSADPEGKPNYIIEDLPPVYPPYLPLREPRIYFGEMANHPVFVHSRIREVTEQLPRLAEGEGQAPEQVEAEDPEPRDPLFQGFPGNRGIRVGGFFRRILISTALSEFSVITTEAFTPRSRVLLRRNIMERATAVYPFLTFDDDPYPVVADGRIYWMLDGYTLTNRYPYAAHTGPAEGYPNYIRNSVKLTIDATTGEMQAYRFEDDPILKVYERIYPGLVKPRSAMPKSLEAHIRYPEDLFFVQCEQLQLYHITDPKVWYQKEDRWSLPRESTEEGGDRPMEAYYCQMRIPDDEKDSFVLMLPFTPLGRPNLAAWLAAYCDPDRYGELVMYRFPRRSSLIGPKQASNLFYQNEEISQWTTLVGQRGSRVRRGNLLVMPVGKSILYVEPLYLQAAGERPIPELKKVAVATQRRAVVGDTYGEALLRLFGDSLPPAVAAAVAGGDRGARVVAAQQAPAQVPRVIDQPLQALAKALQAREEARQALEREDWAAYGAAQKRLDDALRALQRSLGERSEQ